MKFFLLKFKKKVRMQTISKKENITKIIKSTFRNETVNLIIEKKKAMIHLTKV